MELLVENHRLAPINIQHHSLDVQAYYNSAVSEWDKKKRSNAIKAYEIGICEFEDLPMVTETVGRIMGEFGRSGEGSYKAVDIPYTNALEATFAYFTDNVDHFYLRTRLAYEDGIEKYDLHRRGQHYTSSSVFWALTSDHNDVHKPYYVVQFHNANGGYIEREEFRNKDILRKTYGLTKQQLEEALECGEFIFEGRVAYLKIVHSRIEASFEEHLRMDRSLLNTEINFFNQATDPAKKFSIFQSASNTLNDVALYERLLEEDKAYNEKVKHLKGKSAIELWNKRADELRKSYNATKIQ